MKDRYPYIPEGREIKYVPASNRFMEEATFLRNTQSSDLSHATGAVYVLNNKVIGKGANQSALKNSFLQQMHKKGWCLRKIFKIKTGEKYWLCPGCSKSKHHAETRAVKDAKANLKKHKGGDLYLYGHWWCCKPCWDIMLTVDVRNVYLIEGADKLFKR